MTYTVYIHGASRETRSAAIYQVESACNPVGRAVQDQNGYWWPVTGADPKSDDDTNTYATRQLGDLSLVGTQSGIQE